MKHIVLILALALISCNNSNSQNQKMEDDGLTTFYFIRHAEKQDGADPELTAYGKQRATEWVNYFMLKDVDHVISSDTQRTQSTAEPLARSKKLDVETYDVSAVNGKTLLEQYRGKTVVLYGHSNTINKYANDLQQDQNYGELDDADFDHFFIVRIDENGNTNAVKESMQFDID
ncbi:SixA phosphatase family protein [Nonlabens sp. Hel1_33_55]|uniref:SixA phosphatase family protein n=1 Tax=Nonlabens sp. Hel1_33_55 TaxID=1336802 RepID=UPI000B819975|nr:phosphoglycerate mutase family protein [Nonlabens sp. Hel1_33_55]